MSRIASTSSDGNSNAWQTIHLSRRPRIVASKFIVFHEQFQEHLYLLCSMIPHFFLRKPDAYRYIHHYLIDVHLVNLAAKGRMHILKLRLTG